MSEEKANVELLPGERVDDLQRKGYRIIQRPGSFCFGIDAVFLCGFANVRPGESVLDLGTGTGILPILLEARSKGAHFTGIELQPESADMARRSVALNGLGDRIDIVEGDLREAGGLFLPASFHVVTANPPYMKDGGGLLNPGLPKAMARHEITCTLGDVTRAAAKFLRPGGRFYMVHRPFRLTEIVCELVKCGLEPKRMRFVHPFADREPGMVLIESRKGGSSRLTVEKPLIIYESPGKYTEEVRRDYHF